MDRPSPGDRVVYSYDMGDNAPDVSGTVIDVTDGPDIDRWYRPVTRARVAWDPSSRVVPDRVTLGRLRRV